MLIEQLLVTSVLSLLAGGVQECRDLSVFIEIHGVEARPSPADWPFDVRVLANDGSTLASGKTKKDGTVDLTVCWPNTKKPARVEVTWGEEGYIEGEIRGYDGRQRGLCFMVCPIHRSDCE